MTWASLWAVAQQGRTQPTCCRTSPSWAAKRPLRCTLGVRSRDVAIIWLDMMISLDLLVGCLEKVNNSFPNDGFIMVENKKITLNKCKYLDPPREPKTAEKSNPVKKHDVSEKKTGSVKKDGFCQITHHFFTGFLRINTGFLREKYGFHKSCMKRRCFHSKPRRTRCFHQEPTKR